MALSRNFCQAGWLVTLTLTVSSPSWGDTPPPPTASSDSNGGELSDIVVTAERRSERLQDVPIAVTAITADSAAKAGIIDIRSLQQVVPGLDITQQGSGATPFLRGVGSPDGTAGSASSVGMYVDGVYMAAQSAEFFSFNDIERIEVLKGPQGTLFGENTTGGAIQIITKDPSKTPSADVSVGFGNYRTFSESLYATTGIGANSAIDVAAFSNDSLDGWGHNLVSGNPTYEEQNYGVRSKLLWEPDDATEIRLSGDYSRSKSGMGVTTMIVPGGYSFDGVTTNQGFYNATTPLDPFLTQKLWGFGLNIQRDLEWSRLVSISAYREETTFYRFDYAGIPIKVVDADDYNPQHDISQELQLQSPRGSKIRWILGGFYLHSNGIRSDLYTGEAYPPPSFFFQGTYENLSYAAFGQATAEILPDTRLTLGARYTRDERKAYSYNMVGDGPVIDQLYPPSETYSKVTYRASLDHSFTPDIMAYASFNTGFKSGQFNLNDGLNFPPVLPEFLKAYEIGAKTEFFDRRMRVNVAAFYYDYTDIQVSYLLPAGQQTLNAAAAKIRGIDGDFAITPISNLTIDGAFSYLHGRYTDFPNAPAEFANPVPPNCVPGGACGGLTAIPGGVDAAGFTTIHTPTFSGSLGATYTIPTNIGKFDINGNLLYTQRYYVEVDNRLQQPEQHMLNASLGWIEPKGMYELRVWGKNLLDKQYYSFLFSAVPFGDEGAAAPPRTYGITLLAHFR